MRFFLRRLARDASGMSAVEFGLMIPIFLVLGAGMIDFSRLILISQKLQSGTFIVADLAARDKTLSEAQVDDIFLALGNIVEPFDLTSRGTAHVTSVVGVAGSDPEVAWQRTGAGGLVEPSQIGSPGGIAALPSTLVLGDGENMIVSEVFYDFEPIFGISFGADVLRRVAYYRPRLGTLATLAP